MKESMYRGGYRVSMRGYQGGVRDKVYDLVCMGEYMNRDMWVKSIYSIE